MPEKMRPPSVPPKNTSHIEDDVRIKDFAIASSINGIAIGDLNGVVTYVNNAALKMYGTDDPSEVIGKSATVFAQSEQEALQIMHTVLEKGNGQGRSPGGGRMGLPLPCSSQRALSTMRKASLSV